MSESKEESYPPIERIIATIASITTVSILFAAYRESLPSAAQAGVISVIAVLVILFIVWVWYRPLRIWKKAWQRNRMARRNYPQLVRFSERLAEFLEPNRTTNPHRIPMALRAHQGFESLVMPESSYAQLISWDLEKGLKLARPNLKSLIWGADFMDSVIRFYTEQYLVKPVLQIYNVRESMSAKIPPQEGGRPSIPVNWKDEFNAARESFVSFLGEYEEFTSKLNRELGKVRRMVGDNLVELEALRGSHFERPREL